MKSSLSLAAIVSLAVVFISPSPAHAEGPASIPAGVVRDASFVDGESTVVMGDDGPLSRVACPDRAFTAIPRLTNSVTGCNVIGTTKAVQVYYGWYKHVGSGSACIWGKGFDAKARPIWTSLDCGSGRTKAVAWGNVAASKQVRGLTAIGWAGVQWS